MAQPVYVMETTLRDGSYEIDFQFTAFDTAFLISALDRAGFSYIEFGHGAGIGVDDDWSPLNRPATRAAAPDRAHLEAAQAVRGSAKLGVIFVVGEGFTPAARLTDLPRYGIDFVRLAYLPHNIVEASTLDCIEVAKGAGLTVSINLMKTYAMSASEVAKASREVARRGADWFYVVDSAGGMTPDSTREYVKAIRDASGLTVGLHAHNNSGRAVANSLAAVEAGATLIDGSLQGIGRATGNAPTEQLLLALQRDGHEKAVDRDAVMKLGSLARGLFAERGNDAANYASGSVQLHSRALPELKRLAKEKQRSIIDVVIEVGQRAGEGQLLARESFPAPLLEAAIAACPERPAPPIADGALKVAKESIDRGRTSDLSRLCDDLAARSIKRRLPSVVHLVHERLYPYRGSLDWQTADLVGVTLPVTEAALPSLSPDRCPDVLCLDDGLPARADLPRPRNHQVVFSQANAIVHSTAALLRASFQPGDQLALPDEDSFLGRRLRSELGDLAAAAGSTGRRLFVRDARQAHPEELSQVRAGDLVVLVGRGPDGGSLVGALRARGATVLRPPFWLAVASYLSLELRLRERLKAPLGPVVLTGELKAVDPLIAPEADEVIVDAIDHPARVVEATHPDAAEGVARLHISNLLKGRGTL
jgi:4-hydroxy-2-oxovalerate aldolase